MKWLYLVCRILLGALFVFSGVVKFVIPPDKMAEMNRMLPAVAADWSNIMYTSHWMHVVGALEVIGGLLVLIGRTLPLGLCLLCPISVNILLFCIMLNGGAQIAPGLGTALLELVLIYGYRNSFAGILSAKEQPTL